MSINDDNKDHVYIAKEQEIIKFLKHQEETFMELIETRFMDVTKLPKEYFLLKETHKHEIERLNIKTEHLKMETDLERLKIEADRDLEKSKIEAEMNKDRQRNKTDRQRNETDRLKIESDCKITIAKENTIQLKLKLKLRKCYKRKKILSDTESEDDIE